MRYWIFWNDLVQGPFELDELVSLHSFSADLLVCMEGRLEWLPANRIAELAPSIGLLKSRSYPPPIPPLPPTQPPSVTPVQGEFFNGPPGQQDLFAELSTESANLYSYHSTLADESSSAKDAFATVTMPFRFVGQTVTTGDPTGVTPHEMPANEPVVEEPLEVIESPHVEAVLSPVVEETPAPVVEETVAPPAETPPLPRPVIPIRIYTEEPEPPPAASTLSSIGTGILKPELEPIRSWQWLPWFCGALVFLGLIGSFCFWLMDRASSRSAIVEASRQGVKPVRKIEPAPIPTRVEPVKPPVPVKGTAPAKATLSKKSLVPKLSKAKPMPMAPKVVVPVAAVSTERAPAPAPAPAASRSTLEVDPWIGRQADAINRVMRYPLFKNRRTIGSHAKAMLDEMHEKELLHAADTGERLYLPDKLSWAALREEGSVYRVYLNFSAQRATGERVQTTSYQFRVDLKDQRVMSDDNATRQDFLQAPPPPQMAHVTPPLANDIESILSAVDLLNKQKLRMMIEGKGRSKKQRKNLQITMDAAQAKLQRSVVYFRTRYPEKMLQNVANAYLFSTLINSHG